MKIDFLLSKRNPTDRHNITPIEVKSGKNYTFTSLKKILTKYKEQVDTPIVLHTEDYQTKDGIFFMLVYWAWLL